MTRPEKDRRIIVKLFGREFRVNHLVRFYFSLTKYKHKFIGPRYIMEGERYPTLFGIAYFKWESDHRVAYVIPINIIVAVWRRLMFLTKYDIPHWIGKKNNAAAVFYYRGMKKGYEAGRYNKDFATEFRDEMRKLDIPVYISKGF